MTSPVYTDHTYQLSATDHRPNARVVSNTILSGPSGLPSYRNHTALFAFFGKFTRVLSHQWLKWSCEAGGSPDEARLEQTPYPFHTQLIWRYLGIKEHFIDSIRGFILLQGAQIGAGEADPLPPSL